MSEITKSFLSAWLMGLLFVGCPGRSGPAPTIEGYLLAVADGQPQQAWALMSKHAQKKSSYDEHLALMEALTPAQRKNLRLIARNLMGTEVTLTWSHRSGHISIWTKDGERWHINEHLMEQALLGTPQAALKSFILAYQNADYTTLFELVPQSQRKGLSVAKLQDRFGTPQLRSEVDAVISGLQGAGKGIALESNKWRFEKNGHRADFVSEDGVWRLWNLR
jgi:hypothetical protein